MKVDKNKELDVLGGRRNEGGGGERGAFPRVQLKIEAESTIFG